MGLTWMIAKTQELVLTLLRNPFNTDEALTESERGILMGFSRITATQNKYFTIFYNDFKIMRIKREQLRCMKA